MEPHHLADALADHPATTGAALLVLHGSRARGDAGPHSDWDVGYLADGVTDVDPAALVVAVAGVVGTDAVDVVALLERRDEAFLDFRLEAVRFWCDAGPVIRAAYDDVLASLG